MKNFFTVFCLVMFSLAAFSQKLTGDAPSEITAGEQFRLTYTIESQDVSNFRPGSIPEGLEVLIGPNTSRHTSYSIINGKTTSKFSITYTFIVSANEPGTYTIKPATITVGGKTVKSNPLQIKVFKGNTQQPATSGRRQNDGIGSAGSAISENDLFIKVHANKTQVHEQEPILLTYKVYTLVSLTQLVGKMPDLNGFHTQEIPMPQQKSFKLETYNGRTYRTVTWSQYVMFPQMTGKLEIPSITFEGIVVQRNENIDPFEAIFNGGAGYIEVKKKIRTPKVSINVLPLPHRPSDFSGGVGTFDFRAVLDKNEVEANNPLTIKVRIAGNGNLKLIKAPVVNFPKDFDSYDAKLTDNTKLTVNGLEGSIDYEFLAVPRNPGKYEIPPVEFTYYDVNENKYKTLKSSSFKLNVLPGGTPAAGGHFSKQDITVLNKDIRYIKTDSAELFASSDFFYGSAWYWGVISALAIVFALLFYLIRQQTINNANYGKLREKKANKVATTRLKKAKELMQESKEMQFYDEVLHALWGYIGDKLGMPVEMLSRENVNQCLQNAGVTDEIIKMFIFALDECEFERYAPGDSSGNMNKTFECAMRAIIEIENTLKNKSKKTMRMGKMLLLMVLYPSLIMAADKFDGDKAYEKQNYQEAIAIYEAILEDGISPDIYYNLGNAYYRTGNITRAILNYERALLFAPGDSDIRFNLQLARSKTSDKITPEREVFFVTWFNSLVNILGVDGWAFVSIFALGGFVVLFLIYFFSNRIMIRKVSFFSALFFILSFILSNVFAMLQKRQIENRDEAIIISPSVSVKSTPALRGTDLFIIHEGTKVKVIDRSMKNWHEIKLEDGKRGWIQSEQIEII